LTGYISPEVALGTSHPACEGGDNGLHVRGAQPLVRLDHYLEPICRDGDLSTKAERLPPGYVVVEAARVVGPPFNRERAVTAGSLNVVLTSGVPSF